MKYDDRIVGLAKCSSYWALDDATGPPLADWKAGRNATVAGGGLAFGSPGPVRMSRSIIGSGANGQITVPHALGLNGPGTELEVEAWIRWTGTTTDLLQKIGTHHYGLSLLSSGALQGLLKTTSGTYTSTSAAILVGGEWTMVSLSFSAGYLKLYVNGIGLTLTPVGGSHTTNVAPLELTRAALDSRVARMAFYSAALTDAERIENYRVGLQEPALQRRRPRRQLAWSLTDSQGNEVAPIGDRENGEVEIGLNASRRGSVDVAFSAAAAGKARAYGTRLKVWLSGAIILNAPLVDPVWSADERTASLNAIDAGEQLAASHIYAMAKQTQIDQGEIGWRLISHANSRAAFFGGPPTGIVRGSVPISFLRDRFYPDGTNIWEALIDLTEISNGPDFELEPLDRVDGQHMRYVTHWPYQGNDRATDVVLAHNTQEDNAAAFSHEPSGMVNWALFSGQAIEGQPAPAWVAWHPASIVANGVWGHFEALPDVKYTATLREYAEQMVATRAYGVDFFDVTPAVEAGGSALGFYRDANGLWRQDGRGYKVPPAFGPIDSGGAYWIGDEITALARVDGFKKQLVGRVIDAKITELERARAIAVELSCAPRIVATGVSGQALTVTTEDFT